MLRVLMMLLAGCGSTETVDTGTGTDADTGGVADDAPLRCEEPAPDAGITAFDLEGRTDCGQVHWDAACQHCHGADGLGDQGGPPLDEHVPNHTDEQLIFLLIAGSDDMPATGLDPQQQADVLAWMRDQFGVYNGTGH